MLNPSKKRFFKMVETSTVSNCILPFFNKEGLKFEMVNDEYFKLSQSEQIMLMFFSNVWQHSNTFNLDIVAAAKVLDEENRKVIANWLEKPFWP